MRYIISDIDPLLGYMHSGYPIVTMMDITDSSQSNFIFNYNYYVTNGNWGFFH